MAKPQLGAASSRNEDAVTRLEVQALTRPAVNSQASSYTLNAADAGRAVHTTASAVVTITVPLAADVPWAVGTIVLIAQMGTGQVSIAGASGVTIRSAASFTTRTQYSEASLRYLGGDTWLLAGDLT